MRTTMRVLRSEHLALKGVGRILKMEAALLEQGKDVDVSLLKDIVEYIEEFPDTIHHPKEERYIFRAMRARSPQAGDLLDRLYREHLEENALIAEFGKNLNAYENDREAGREDLAKIARIYSEFLEGHMKLENEEAFPLAEKVLTEEDWADIDAAFAENRDPFATGEQLDRFANLHRRIVGMGLPLVGMPKD